MSEQGPEVENLTIQAGGEVPVRDAGLDRRQFIGRAAAAAATFGVVGGGFANGSAAGQPRRAPGSGRVVPLPSADQVKADYQRMVDFGPRLPGYEEHLEFCDWVEDEFVRAGLALLPTDQIRYRRWRPGAMSLDVAGTRYTPATSYVRAPGTPAEGVTGPLVLDTGKPDAGPDPAEGSILLVELNVPTPMTAGFFIAMADYWQWRGHTAFEAAAEEFNRFATSGWPASLQSYLDRGARGVVFIVNASREETGGNWSPHQARVLQLPAVVVDRDMGAELKQKAAGQPDTTLRLEADWKDTHVPQITGILPGESDEVIVINSHTDGQNAFEENGAVALVHLARHFASLQGSQKLKRTLVFIAWPGHMADVRNLPDDPNTLPEQFGWITAHRDIFDRTIAAITIEHLGATRWTDDPVNGYHATGDSDFYAIWTTLGAMQELCKVALKKSDLQRHALLRPPIQVTPGVAWHHRGIPHVAGISNPRYLVRVSENGDMDKLDPKLASRQTAFYADVVKRLDGADPAELLAGAEGDSSFNSVPDRFYPVTRARSGPARKVVLDAGKGRRLSIWIGGRANRNRDLMVELAALDRPIGDIRVRIYRDDVLLGGSGPVKITRKPSRVPVHRLGHRRDHRNIHRRRGGRRFGKGTYTVEIRQGRRVLGRRNIRIGGSR